MTTELIAPRWSQDLAVVRGDDESNEVVLFDATGDLSLSLRLASAWMDLPSGVPRPWIALASTPEARRAVMSYFGRAPGEDDEHDRKCEEILQILPLDRCWLTVVEINEGRSAEALTLETSPPAYERDARVHAVWQRLRASEFSCPRPERDESSLCVQYQDSMHSWSEQVISWEPSTRLISGTSCANRRRSTFRCHLGYATSRMNGSPSSWHVSGQTKPA